MKELKLSEWIEKYGVDKLSKKLNYRKPTVWKWLRGDGPPDARTIFNLIKLSKGKLTFNDIYIESSRRTNHEHIKA